MQSEHATPISLERKALRIAIIIGLLAGVVYLLQSILFPFLFGIAVAYVLNPAVTYFNKQGVSRSMAAAAALIIALVVIGGIGILLVPIIYRQTLSLIENFPTYVVEAYEWLDALAERYNLRGLIQVEGESGLAGLLSNFTGTISSQAGGIISGIIRNTGAFINFLGLVFVAPAVAFYLMRDWPVLISKVMELVPPRHRSTLKKQAKEMDVVLGGFLKGQIFVSGSLSVLYAVGFQTAGLNLGFAIGIGAGLLSAIPVIGGTLTLILVMIAAFFQFGLAGEWVRVIVIAGVWLVGQLLENNVLAPRFIGDRIKLHPVWLIFSVLAGGTLFGIIGVIVAIPAAATLGVVVRFTVELYRKSEFYLQGHIHSYKS